MTRKKKNKGKTTKNKWRPDLVPFIVRRSKEVQSLLDDDFRDEAITHLEKKFVVWCPEVNELEILEIRSAAGHQLFVLGNDEDVLEELKSFAKKKTKKRR